MKAARFHAREDVRIDDLPEPETREGAVKIKVDWCGICGTDLHEYLEGPIFTPAEVPHPLTGERNPVQLGHEFAGHVTEVGRGVTGFAEGDAVTVEPTLFCGECAECRAGLTNLCPSLGFHGLSGGGGGFAEYTAVPASMVRPLGQVPTDLGAPSSSRWRWGRAGRRLGGVRRHARGRDRGDPDHADDLIDVGFFITRIKLVDGGFHELIQNKDEHVKVLVQP